MLTAIAISHRDAHIAARLSEWMRVLGVERPDKLLIVLTPMAADIKTHPEVSAAIENFARVWPNVVVHQQATEDERGWPMSANSLFFEAMRWAEQHEPGQPVLWIEPDVVPLKPYWYERIKSEYESQDLPFMGTAINHAVVGQHMSGIGVYPPDWRERCERLAEVERDNLARKDNGAWDPPAGSAIIEAGLLHETKLIQHLYGEKARFSSVDAVRKKLSKDAVLFHQCKNGALIEYLKEILQIHEPIDTSDHETKRRFYVARDVSGPISWAPWSHKRRVTSRTTALLMLDKQEDILRFEADRANAPHLVKEIEEEEYLRRCATRPSD